MDPLKISEAVERGGVVAVLVFVCLGLTYAYWKERHKNWELHQEFRVLSRETTKVLLSLKGIGSGDRGVSEESREG